MHGVRAVHVPLGGPISRDPDEEMNRGCGDQQTRAEQRQRKVKTGEQTSDERDGSAHGENANRPLLEGYGDPSRGLWGGLISHGESPDGAESRRLRSAQGLLRNA